MTRPCRAHTTVSGIIERRRLTRSPGRSTRVRPMSRDLPQRIAPNGDVILTEMGDGTAVLLNMKTKFYYTLNETAAFLWKHIEGGASLDALADALSATFAVD